MKLFKLLPTIAATALAASLSVVANAAPITGSINFTGGVDLTLNGASDAVSEIDFLPTGSANAEVTVSTLDFLVTGSFDGLEGDMVTILDVWNLDTQVLPTNLWTVGGFTFELNSVTENTYDNGFTMVTGTGTLSAAGFTNTTAEFNLSSQGGTTVSFSATTVPEPSAAALLGLGLVGLAIGRRRARK